MDISKTVAGIRTGGLLCKALYAPRLCPCVSWPHARVDVTEGMTAAHHAHEARAPLVSGRVQDALLWPVQLVSSGGKEIAVL